MALSQPTYEAINGLEAKEILKRNICNKIDKIPLLNGGNAFHKLRMIYSVIFSAFPSDCPVPEDQELELLLKAPEFDSQVDYLKLDGAIKKLEAKRTSLEEGLEKIKTLLQKLNPTIEITEDLNAGNTPDVLRIAHDLPVPRIEKRTSVDGSTHKVGVMRKASEI